MIQYAMRSLSWGFSRHVPKASGVTSHICTQHVRKEWLWRCSHLYGGILEDSWDLYVYGPVCLRHLNRSELKYQVYTLSNAYIRSQLDIADTPRGVRVLCVLDRSEGGAETARESNGGRWYGKDSQFAPYSRKTIPIMRPPTGQ